MIHVIDTQAKRIAEELQVSGVQASENEVRQAFDEEDGTKLDGWELESTTVGEILRRQQSANSDGQKESFVDEPPLEPGEWADPNGCCRVVYRDTQDIGAYCWKNEWGHNEDEHRSEVLERYRTWVAEEKLAADVELRIAADRIERANNQPHPKGCACTGCAQKKKPPEIHQHLDKTGHLVDDEPQPQAAESDQPHTNGRPGSNATHSEHGPSLRDEVVEYFRANPRRAYEQVLGQSLEKKRGGKKGELYAWCPFHKEKTDPDWRVDLNKGETGSWCCNVCDHQTTGGALFDLVALLNNWNTRTDFPAILKWLAELFSLGALSRASASSNHTKTAKPQASKQEDDEAYQPVVPIPEHAPDLPDLLKFIKWLADNKIAKDGRTLTPEEEANRFDYRDEQRRWCFSTIRYNYVDLQADGTKKPGKDVLPASLWRRRNDKRLVWRSKWPEAPRPLFALEQLAAAPEQSPLLVEGELKAELTNTLAGFKYVAVAFSGGAQRANQSDYSPLAKRAVTEWPDNDASGCRAAIKAAHAIGQARKKNDGKTTESVQIVKPDPEWPDGHDIADLIKAGWTAEQLHQYITDNSVSVDEFERYARERFRTTYSVLDRYCIEDNRLMRINPLNKEGILPLGTIGAIIKRQDGVYLTPLTNFVAQITADIAQDDGGDEIKHLFEIEAKVGDKSYGPFEVPAKQFGDLGWISERLGSGATIFVGKQMNDHVKTAIQIVSTAKRELVEYKHLGWRSINDIPVYLYAGGALGPNGPVTGIHVAPRAELALFQLPAPPADPRQAISASFKLLGRESDTGIAPDRLIVPAFGAIPRAIIGEADWSVYLLGPTGKFKTEFATLAQQHYGPNFTSRMLPASFASTANFNEELGFVCKDAVMVIDDYHPQGNSADREKMQREAARFFRAVGNQAGRGRMERDRSLRSGRWPRCLPIGTGEDLLPGQSLNSRLLILEVLDGDITKEKLTQCQLDASLGFYAQTTSAFIVWVAREFTAIRQRFREQVENLQAQFTRHHPRAWHIHAQLIATFQIFSEFLVDAKAIGSAEQSAFLERIGRALNEAIESQTNFGAVGSNPVLRFQQLLRSAIATGTAHLAASDGEEPMGFEAACGWREKIIGTGDNQRQEWQPQGTRVGWLLPDTNNLYLDPDASYGVAQRIAPNGNGIEVEPSTLRRRLREAGVLMSTDAARQTLSVRVTVQGSRKEVLHLRPEFLGFGETEENNDNVDDEVV
jgi:hypothetical protein